MVPAGRGPLTTPRRRAVAAFLVAAVVVWWIAHRHGAFFVSGVGPRASDLLGPLLPALSAGLSIALVLSLVDLVTGTLTACLAVLVVLLLPGFAPLHGASLVGPPMLAATLLQFAVMLSAPRFSLAYGTIAAVAAVWIDSAAVGLPLAAVAWAWLSAHRGGTRPWRRMFFAVVPLLIVLLPSGWASTAWPSTWDAAWRGGLDRGLQAAGRVIGDQLAPTLTSPAVRWFAIADLTLVMGAIVLMAARRARSAPPTSATGAFHPAAATLAGGVALGLALRWLFVPASPAPTLEAVLPLMVLAVVTVLASAGMLWRRWPRWGKVLALLVLAGWMQAAIRG